jgi:hypothetical protein
MTKLAAQVLGALAAVLVMGFVMWRQLGPRPCTGGVFLEFRPPLAEPGPYRFRLELQDRAKPCEFSVALPPAGEIDTSACEMALALKTRVQGTRHSIVGLTFGASPQNLKLRIDRGAERIYDVRVEPKYSPYPVRRGEDKRFCGEQAFVKPACVRGSSQCAPYRPTCDGPEDCPEHKVCCVSPEWGKEYGTQAASECVSARACLDRFARIACHESSACPKAMSCDDASLRAEFSEPILVCRASSK